GGSTLDVLRGASLQIQSGEVVMLAGPSGSGKSTLLAILGCLLTPDAGHLNLAGQLPFHMSEAGRTQLRSETIGYIFQRCHLIQGLTAIDNVMMTALLRGEMPRDAEALALELLHSVGMADFKDSLSTQMSLGQCQRVAVARALAGQPRILLADEPTASLDHRNGEEVIELIRRVGKQENRAAIVVTHDQRIFPYADRVLWVEEGLVHEHSGVHSTHV
ncbi:MAG: ABC transporter ATP-binding protein, partial [Planctomycetota bacterium]|nr:ABC transporter ATP-binding protein [Planctomycetota bacterium]